MSESRSTYSDSPPFKNMEPNSPPLEGKLGQFNGLSSNKGNVAKFDALGLLRLGHKNDGFHSVLYPSNHSGEVGGRRGGGAGVSHHVLRTGHAGSLTKAHMERNCGRPPSARTSLSCM